MKPVDLIDHPEGGRFREIFRSPHTVRQSGKGERSALTHIYFSLDDGEISRFHRVESDEVWNLYRGDGVRLYVWDGESTNVDRVELTAASNRFCHVVPAGMWQAAEPVGGSVLAGCTVGPGFEFDDFKLLDSVPEAADRLLKHRPDLAALVGNSDGSSS